MRPAPAIIGALLGAAVLTAVAPSLAQEVPRFVQPVGDPLLKNIARSLAIGDYDNDGYPDLLTARLGDWKISRIGCFRNLAGAGFSMESTDTFPLSLTPEVYGGGAIFGDYDNDGDLDIYVPVGQWYLPGADYLLRNDRGIFTDVTASSGIQETAPSDNAIWLDYDRDGLLDLYVGHMDNAWLEIGDTIANPAVRNTLYRNLGDGSFQDVTASAGLLVPFSDAGGSNGGMVSADLDDDGWPDLFVSVYGASKRLFLNDRHGGFIEATTADMQDDGEAFGVAAADVDNDGRLDLFAVGGGSGSGSVRSLLLLNLGQGAFIDALEALGLGSLADRQLLGTGMADLDNDGDQDLLVGDNGFWRLFLNQGDGTYAEPARTSSYGNNVALGDLDLDGAVDLVANEGVFIQQSRGGHWLVVELAGRQSNRNGIGARVQCLAGDLRQAQQVLGGRGYVQDELVARFGLGDRKQVDSLEVRWPSGQVDRLGPLAVDQRLRVFEGGPVSLQVEPTRWISVTPETLRAGSTMDLTAVVRPALYEPGGQVTAATADLRGLGGPEAVPLALAPDGTCRLTAKVAAPTGNGRLAFPVLIDQSSSLGPYWIRTFSPTLTIIPSEDLTIYAEALDPRWSVSRTVGIDTTRRASSAAYEGAVSWSLVATSANWQANLKPVDPVELAGYQALHLAVFPAEGTLTRLSILLGGSIVTVYPAQPEGPAFDPSRRSWQVLEIPLAPFQDQGALSLIVLLGTGKGILCVDDLRLVAAPFTPPSTAVAETVTRVLPQSPALAQNYPNPFNSSTVFRFSLPQAGEVGLSVYDLLGQRLAVLAAGPLAAGEHTVAWDGRDGQGRPLASGVYLCRLEAGGMSRVRRLALVR